MREIKFRAKPLGADTWIYGGGVQRIITPSGDRYGMLHLDDAGRLMITFVQRETVGQYTGLKDKNRVEIYQGDVVYSSHIADQKHGPVEFSDIHHGYMIDYPRRDGQNQSQHLHGKEHCLAVIGNIHDGIGGWKIPPTTPVPHAAS